jgi:hypothetical protein
MDNKSKSIKPADARIVQAVRKLKSSKVVDQTIEVRKNQEDIKGTKNISSKQIIINNTTNEQKTKKALTPINQKDKKNNTNDNIINVNSSNSNININQNKNTIVKRDISKSSSKNKISIDGSLVKPNTGSTSNKTITNNNKTFDYETLKKYKKRQKSDYQKNLLSKKSLDKYKEECVTLIKKEPEMKNLFGQIGINKDDDYLLYISNNFFNKPHFLFALEILILETVEETNTLKVFRTNKNVLPLKVVKENFYRDEILKDLKLKIYEGEYSNKFNNLMKNLDNFIDSLKNEEI